jgi:3-oxoadipate enol-lactonase
MLLCNGWGGSSDSWSGEMLRLLAERHTLILVDNRGTGRSGKPTEPYTMKGMSGDSAAVLEETKLQPAHVLGFSMGGVITQALAIYHRNLVKSMILCATSTGSARRIPMSTEAAAELALVSDDSLSKRERVEKMVYLLYPREYVLPRLEQLVKEESYDENPTPIYALKNQSAALAGFDSYDLLPGISLPVLVMAGECDRLIPPGNSNLIASRIPASELHILGGLGHGLLKQATAETSELILSFTARVDRGARV